MTTLSTKFRLNLQLGVATLLVLAGLALIWAGFVEPPVGEIHNSVLIAFGELLTFAGSLYGIDYKYKYKEYRHRLENLGDDSIINEENEEHV